MDRGELVNRVNRALDLPLAVLSLVMLALVLTDVLVAVPHAGRMWLERVNWTIWAVFALEFAAKLLIAPQRRQYLRTHWFDALVALVPMFRVVRALRILRVTRAVPLFRLAAFIGMGLRGTRAFVAHYRMGYLLALSGLVTLGGAAVVLLLERDVPGTRFHTFGDALWWSAALMTTIGSDLNPRTGLGRLVALIEMLFAMVVFVYVVGALSSELLHRRGGTREPTVQQGVEELEGEVGWDSGAGDERKGPRHAPRGPIG